MLLYSFAAHGIAQRTSLIPRHGSVHWSRPSRLRSHCVPMPPAVEVGGIDREVPYFANRAFDEAVADEAADEARVEMVELVRSQRKDVNSSLADVFVLGADAVGIEYSRGRKYGSQLRLPSGSVVFVPEPSDVEESAAKGAPQKQRPLQ